MKWQVYVCALAAAMVFACGDDDGTPGVDECLGDGSGSLEVTLSGALSGTADIGNDLDCAGLGSSVNQDLTITLQTVVPGTTDTLALLLNVDDVTVGQTATGLDVNITVSTGGMSASQWQGDCTLDITTFDMVSGDAVGDLYKVAATVACTDPLDPFLNGDTLTLSNFSLVTVVAYAN